jgi:Predicted nuclease of the RecB family
LALYEFSKTAITALAQTTFATQNIDERVDLQRLLQLHIGVIAPDTLLIAEEFSEWDESKRRIDLLGIDRDANLVVIELKRTEDGGHMELQAIRYAAMISAMTFSEAVEIYGSYLERNKVAKDAKADLLAFLKWEVATDDIFGKAVRVILVSAEFSKEITTSVLWLNEQGLDIRCVRLRPYALEDRVILDVQQVIPLPEAEFYTVQIKKKAEEIRQAKHVDFDLSRYDLTIDGTTFTHLWKRRLVFKVVQAAIAKGIAPEDIAAVVPANKWISVPGELTVEEFQDEASKVQGKLGGKYNPNRYFCSAGELFHLDGKTYALSNQWSLNNISVIDEIIAKLPPGSVTYSKAMESN